MLFSFEQHSSFDQVGQTPQQLEPELNASQPQSRNQCLSRCNTAKSSKSRSYFKISTPLPINIKVQSNQTTNPQAPQQKQCRICLQGIQQGRMIRPCQCSGSVTYAHQKCIIQWIKRKHESISHKSKSKPLPFCEICSKPFNYKHAKRRSLDSQTFCQNYKKQKLHFTIFIILGILLLLSIIGLMTLITQSDKNTQIGIKIKQIIVKTQNIKIVFISLVFIFFIVLMFLTILFVIQYAVKSELVISQVMDYMDISTKKRGRIYPKGLDKGKF